MAKFIKLRLRNIPKKLNEEQWRMVIDNKKDLDDYHSLNAVLNMEAFMTMERDENGDIALSHTGAAPTRAIVLQRLLHTKITTTPAGEKIYPIIEVAKFTDAKYLGMLRFIENFGAIQMNAVGGYCGLKSFIETWDATIVEEIEKSDFGFPIEDAVIKADTIVLENSHKEYTGDYIEQKAKREIKDSGDVKTIYNLREMDKRYLFKCISGCKNVVIQTQAQDEQQLTDFLTMFGKMPRKNIYLYVSESTKNKIQSHPLFTVNNTIHSVNFITT